MPSLRLAIVFQRLFCMLRIWHDLYFNSNPEVVSSRYYIIYNYILSYILCNSCAGEQKKISTEIQWRAMEASAGIMVIGAIGRLCQCGNGGDQLCTCLGPSNKCAVSTLVPALAGSGSTMMPNVLKTTFGSSVTVLTAQARELQQRQDFSFYIAPTITCYRDCGCC